MMDKNREAFEAWFEDSGNAELCAGSSVGTTIKMIAWEAFRASWGKSRQEIEVDLPQRQSLCASGYGDGYFVPSNAGEGLEYDEVVEAITSLGIRVKGNEE